MAGDIEEPFRLTFEPASLHSGSISFGRFESEALCWERRSSFNHNRYLEEVEKYAKPGSVTEKKAYFEEHFRKRALLRMSSSERQNGTESPNSEREESNNKIQEEGNLQQVNKFAHSACSDKSPCDSVDDLVPEVIECDQEDSDVSCSKPQVEPSANCSNGIDGILQDLQLEETCRAETGSAHLHCTKLGTKVEESYDEFTTSDGASEVVDPSSSSVASENEGTICSEYQQDTSRKIRIMNPKLVSKLNCAQGKTKIPQEANKEVFKRPRKREIDASRRPKSEYQEIIRKPVHKDSRTPMEKVINNRTNPQRDSRTTKVVKSHSSGPKVSPRPAERTNRPMQLLSSANPGMRSNSSAISFKSNECVERRKEYYPKLDEKLYAESSKMHHSQRLMQEKIEAQTKQTKRNLNFKATPLPSFYHESASSSDKNKAAPGSTKLRKPQNISTERPPYNSKTRDGLRNYSNRSSSATSSTKAAFAISKESTVSLKSKMPSPSTVGNAQHSAHTSRVDNVVSRRKEDGKAKLAHLQQNKVSEGISSNMGRKVEGRLKVGAARSSNSVVKKAPKAGHLGTSARKGRSEVAVAY